MMAPRSCLERFPFKRLRLCIFFWEILSGQQFVDSPGEAQQPTFGRLALYATCLQ